MIIRCLLITCRASIMLMNVYIPCSGIHSRIGQRLNGERMIRPAGEWESRDWDSYGKRMRVRVTDAVCIRVMGYKSNV